MTFAARSLGSSNGVTFREGVVHVVEISRDPLRG